MAIQFSFTSDAVRIEPAAEILLVQHDQHRVDMTLDVLDRHHLANRVHVVRDGVEALEFLFCTGAYADRIAENPRLVLLDLDVALADNLDVLRQIRRDPLTNTIPVTVLACSPADRLTAMAVFHEHQVDVPVVVIDGTAHDDEIAELHAQATGASGHSAVGDSSDAESARTGGANEKAVFETNLDDVSRERELESLARMARGMAHELNNLFSVVVAYTELLLKDLDPDDPRRDGAEAIFKAIARGNKLARQLQTFTVDARRTRARPSAGSSASRAGRRSGKSSFGSTH